MPVDYKAMLKLVTAAALCVVSLSTHAGPCATLDEPKMKAMSAAELAAETCKASQINAQNYDQVMLNMSARQGPEPHPKAQDDFDQCQDQIDRLLRALRTKEVHSKVADLCKKK